MKLKHLLFLSHSVSCTLGIALGLAITVLCTKDTLINPPLIDTLLLPIIGLIFVAITVRVFTLFEFKKRKDWPKHWNS